MKVFDLPDEVPWQEPDYAKFDWNKERAREAEHMAKLEAWLKANGYDGEHTGKIASFPVADGAAQYMIADGGRRFHLIKLPYGDAWDYQHIQYLPKAEILRSANRNEALKEIFSKPTEKAE